MKKLFAFIGAVCLMAGSASAYVTDAPHNETNNVSCGDCHTYSLWWQYSPATQDTTTGYASIADAVCDSCHTKIDYPNKISHSFTSMAEMHNDATGDWSTKCVDCHDPHQQAQLEWLADNATLANYLFLVTGTVDTVDTDTPQAGETTINYNPALTINNSAWQKSDDLDPEILTWENKNKTSGRGLIFVHDIINMVNTYSIISADNSTIVLRGTPDSSEIASNDSFGLIYGQLVKKNIETPNSGSRAVKFFDPLTTIGTGGFVDQVNPTREGVCQVCHTLTDYWLEDGTVVNAARFTTPPTDHNSGASCTSCHDTADGFKPTNADHTFMASTGTTCANCHADTEDVVIDTHNGVCSHCHTSPPVLHGNFGVATGKWPSTPHVAGDCTACHDANGPAPQDIAGDFTNHPKALDDDDNASNGFDGHAGQVTADTNCTLVCHFHRNKDIITQIHTGVDNTTPIDPCVKCHELSTNTPGSPGTYDANNTMTAKGTYTGSGKLQGSALAGPGNCVNCHSFIEDDFENHKYRNTHAGQVYATGTGLCSRCHFGDPIKDVHKWDCGHCHDGLLNGGLKSLALEHGPGDCVNCHGNYFYDHDLSKFERFFHQSGEFQVLAPEPPGSLPDCMACHNEGPDLIYDIHSPIIPPGPTEPAYNTCANCHDDAGYLRGGPKGSAVNRGLLDSGFADPNICSTCHADRLTGHPSHVGSGSGSEMNGFVLATERCVSCHIGGRVTDVHNNNCLDCHKNLFRQGYTDLVDGLPAPVYNDPDGHLTCVQCHAALGNSFLAGMYDISAQKDHWKASDHTNQVVQIAGCENCHNANLQIEVHKGCASCHAIFEGYNLYKGTLIGSASGRATGKSSLTPLNTCMDCHGEFILHSSSSITPAIDISHTVEAKGQILLTPSCGITGCHAETDLVNGIHATNGCATCHSDSGEWMGSVLNSAHLKEDLITGDLKTRYGGTCTDCHTTYFDGHNHGTNSHFLNEEELTDLSDGQPCLSCHNTGNWSGILTRHTINSNGGCATCHSSTRSKSIDPYFVDNNGDGNTSIADVIYWGDNLNIVHCLDCHANASTLSSNSGTHPAQ